MASPSKVLKLWDENEGRIFVVFRKIDRLYLKNSLKIRGFLRILKKPQKSWPHSHLGVWGFSRVSNENSQKFWANLTSKILKVFRKCYSQPQRFSKFENETENSRDMRTWLPTQRTLDTWNGMLWEIFLNLKPMEIAKRPYNIICRSIKVMHFCQIIRAWLNIWGMPCPFEIWNIIAHKSVNFEARNF